MNYIQDELTKKDICTLRQWKQQEKLLPVFIFNYLIEFESRR